MLFNIKKAAITILLVMLASFIFILNAQPAKSAGLKSVKARKYSSTDWVSMMRDRNVNVHDVHKAFYKWYKKNHKEDENKDKDKLTTGEKGEEDESYELFRRWEWYNAPRADINGNRADIYKIGSDYESFLHNRSSHASMHSVITNASWAYVGNTTVPSKSSSGMGGDGRVNRVRLFPGNNNILYACTASGGLWKTTNGGTSWTTNTDQLGDLTTSDIAINPLKTNIMYLATGDGDGIQSIYPTPATIGVLKSYDGGNTWNATGLAYTMSTAGAKDYSVNELLIDPNDTAIIIAATTFGIYRSTNSGATWIQTQTGWFHSIEFEPGHPSIVYAGASSNNGGAMFYRSTDNGTSWTRITSGLPSSSSTEGFDIAVTAADSNVIYVLADSVDYYDYNGLYLSTNDGVSFTKQSGDPTSPNILGREQNGRDYGVGQGWYDLTMAVSQTNKDSVWVGGINIWASSNGGVSWRLNADWTGSGASYVHADIHDIRFIPGTNSKGYIAGCDGGVFTTSNSGKTWKDISSNLENGQQYSIGPSASTAGLWITGWQDNGTNLSTSPWSQVYGGDGMDCFIDWSNNKTFYAETADGDFIKSINAGASWYNIGTDISENGPWVTQWLQDPKTLHTLYSGFSNVWKSTDSGAIWNRISAWGGTGSITALAVDSANTNYIYAAQSNIIELTTNGGTNWNKITGKLPTGSASISAIAVNAKEPSHVWVTFSGYSSDDKVFASTNSGSTWTNISNGLPNLPVNCIVSESGSADGIYVGTDQGVYYHDTVLNSWIFYNTGLPLVMIADLKIYEPGKELLAATYGRGTWETPLYSTVFVKPVAYFKASSILTCTGNSVLFTDTSYGPPTSWKWTFTGGTPSTSTLQAPQVVYADTGTYTVKLAVSNTDGSDSLTKTSYITVNASPSVSATVTNNIICNGENTGSVSASPSGGTSPYTYLWSEGGSSSAKTGLTAGTYTITLTDRNGCTAIDSAIVTQPAAMDIMIDSVHITGDSGTCTGVLTATVVSGGIAPYTYLWLPGGQATDTAKGLCPGTYCCKVTDGRGCTDSACINTITGIPAIRNSSNINIYPDPNTGSFTVTGITRGEIIELYNYLGQRLNNIVADNSTIYFDISAKANGIYLVRVLSKDGNLVTQKKILKMQ